jgi:uncharacterized protein
VGLNRNPGGVTFNYTTVLNIVFLVLGAVLGLRFLHTGGPVMLRRMSKPVGGLGQDSYHA